ncbi:MAG: hypothetical protein QM692_12985 [Thermomicrobiales bacterium]
MSTPEELRALSRDVADLDAGVSARLSALADAVQRPEDHLGWSMVDIYAVVQPNDAVAALRRAWTRDRGLARLETARNLLVLLPILLTWLGLWHASASYGALLAEDPTASGKPFLYLWEQGFPGAPGIQGVFSFLTFSRVALADVMIILVIIAITALVHRRINVQQVQRETAATALTRRLHDALAAAALEFGAVRLLNQGVGAGSIAEALLGELRAERERVTELSTERERETANLREFAQDIRDGAKGFARTFADMRVTLDTLSTISAQFADHHETLTAQQADLLEVNRKLATEFERFSFIQRTATAQLASVGETLAENSGDGTERLSRLAAPIGELKQEIHDLSTHLERERLAYQQTARTIAGASAEMTEALAAFRKTAELLDTLPEVSKTLTSAAANQQATADHLAEAARSFQSASRELHGQITESHESLDRLVVALQESAPAVQRSHEAVADMAESVADLSRQVADALDATPREPKRRWFGR